MNSESYAKNQLRGQDHTSEDYVPLRTKFNDGKAKLSLGDVLEMRIVAAEQPEIEPALVKVFGVEGDVLAARHIWIVAAERPEIEPALVKVFGVEGDILAAIHIRIVAEEQIEIEPALVDAFGVEGDVPDARQATIAAVDQVEFSPH